MGLSVPKRSREEATVKIPGRLSGVVRGFATSGALAIGAIFFARALAARSTARNISAQSADSHNITGSTAGVTLAAIGYAFSRTDSVFARDRCVRKPDLEQISG